ncbi:phosphotransferase [Pseudonocardia sp. TRM90224]|uniref:phosphotransferase n=1 Tax=Pseudonocardia sp. TRM90224 TaxID=2812678 RepID=UPI0027E0100E|nr:phosphotransferase [Pseudonocardia sp. TRM90224]
MEEPDVRRAIEAGRATASAAGLRADDAVVVHNSDRIAMRMLPCDVLARVAPAAHRVESEFEVEVARRLAAVDGPVAELDPRVEPRVHVRDGFAISLWTYYEPSGSEIAPVDYAEALSQVHAALRQVDLVAPRFTDRVAGALSALGEREQTPALCEPDRELLLGSLSGLNDGDGKEQLLHGEPHPGNLLDTRRGPLFIDLATCCRGPIEFDLAHAPEDVAAHYPGVDDALVHRCRVLNWAMFTTWRFRRDDQFPDRDRWRREGLDNVRAALERSGRD